MSLYVHDSRSRGRSKSPGREDERSRSRDIRAPSPAAKSKKSSKKYYSDEESDSDSKTKSRHPKKYYDDDDHSDPGGKSKKKPSKKRHDDDDSDSGGRIKKKNSKKIYESESSESDHRRKRKQTKKRYEEESESSESSDSGTGRHPSRRKHSKPKRDEPRHRRDPSPDSHATALTRKGEYIQSSKPQYERERREGRHASYASPDDYEHARPRDYTRSTSYSSTEGSGHERAGHTLPGQYKWEYDHPPEGHERDYRMPATSGLPEQPRHMSINAPGNFNVNMGAGHQPLYPQNPVQPTFAQPQYGFAPPVPRPDIRRTHSGGYQYADPSQNVSYMPKNEGRKPSYTQSAQPQFIEAKPHNPQMIEARPHSGALQGHELGQKLQRLSISGGAAAGAFSLGAPGQDQNHAHAVPPGSPLLEAYHGTYQSISPMPSPLMLPSTEDDDLSDIEQLSPQYSSDDTRHRALRKPLGKKRVSFYDPEPDALKLAAALKHTKPDPGPVISVLPRLSNDHVLELRTEYKKHIKVNGKGINIAKHIKMKVPGNLGKIAYAVALGQWESEAHWANFWYQSNTSRRELLIESLMRRTNSEIVKIKDAFSDKRYNDSLEKCMQTELKKDKFRNAVLLALEERRMSEDEKLSIELVRRDVQDLYKALTSSAETAMINIIVARSNNHLREALRIFEGAYKKNFAREMIKKSQNLVVRLSPNILQICCYLTTYYRARPLRTSSTGC